ncbi:MAG: adenylate/guanylate cyclase domain-containing protein, partial [Kiloniellales bacterium]
RAAGLPIERATFHIRQLHHRFSARSLTWEAEAGGAMELSREHGIQNRTAYLASPVRVIYEEGRSLRLRLEDPDCPRDYPVVGELIERDYRDYAIFPLAFTGNKRNAASIATKRHGGFSDLDLAIFESVLPTVSLVLELHETARLSRQLLNTYVGRQAGERVLNGTVQRGMGERIHAVLWYCDLRGFTALSEKMEPEGLVALLDDYFERVAHSVERRGGEILKFVGDAMLVIFPCQAGEDTCAAADRALDAAEESLAELAAYNKVREAAGQPALDCGIAVHVGDVVYGNVGAADRLDFTVIGAPVNLVARLEAFSSQSSVPIVVSADIARQSQRTFQSLGRHRFKGISAEHEVFGLAPAAMALSAS